MEVQKWNEFTHKSHDVEGFFEKGGGCYEKVQWML